MTDEERRQVEKVIAAGDALARATQHCPHACEVPCPHTRATAAARATWTKAARSFGGG